MRAKKAHTDPPDYYNKTGGGEGKTIEELYDDVEEGPSKTEQQWELYKELDLGTVGEKSYEGLTRTEPQLRTRQAERNTVEEVTLCVQCM